MTGRWVEEEWIGQLYIRYCVYDIPNVRLVSRRVDEGVEELVGDLIQVFPMRSLLPSVRPDIFFDKVLSCNSNVRRLFPLVYCCK